MNPVSTNTKHVLFPAHQAIPAVLAALTAKAQAGKLERHTETIATLGSILEETFFPQDIGKTITAFVGLATQIGQYASVKDIIAELERQRNMGAEQAQRAYTPFHDVMLKVISSIRSGTDSAPGELRTALGILDTALVPDQALKSVASLVAYKIAETDSTEKSWAIGFMTGMSRRLEETASFYDYDAKGSGDTAIGANGTGGIVETHVGSGTDMTDQIAPPAE